MNNLDIDIEMQNALLAEMGEISYEENLGLFMDLIDDSDEWSFSSTSESNSSVSFSDVLSTLLSDMKDSIFTEVQAEVSSSISDMLEADMKDSLNPRRTFSLTSDILSESLKQINSGIVEILHMYSPKVFLLTESINKRVAKNLLISTVIKIQDCLQMCRAANWLETFEDSTVNIKQELDDTLLLAAVRASGDILQSMLSYSSEGPSNSFDKTGSGARLYNFFQDVADNISSLVNPSRQARFSPTLKHPEGSTGPSRTRSRCDVVLENIVFSSINGDSDRENLSSEDFIDEASMMVSHIINKESDILFKLLRGHKSRSESVTRRTAHPILNSNIERKRLAAATGVVCALASELAGIFETDSELTNPKMDSEQYAALILSVTENILNTVQEKMKEVLLKDLFMQVSGDMNTTDNAGLGCTMLFKSRLILKIITDRIRAIPALSDGSRQLTMKLFFQSLDENLDLLTSEIISDSLTDQVLDMDWTREELLKDLDKTFQTEFEGYPVRTTKRSRLQRFLRCILCCGTDQASLSSLVMIPELPRTPRSGPGITISLPRVRFPKFLRFKKKQRKSTNSCVDEVTKKRPIPAEATSPSTKNSAPKLKLFFSRVAAAISKICRKN